MIKFDASASFIVALKTKEIFPMFDSEGDFARFAIGGGKLPIDHKLQGMTRCYKTKTRVGGRERDDGRAGRTRRGARRIIERAQNLGRGILQRLAPGGGGLAGAASRALRG